MSLLRFFHKAASQQTAGPGNRGSTGGDATSALHLEETVFNAESGTSGSIGYNAASY